MAGYRYYLNFVDKATSFNWVFPIKTKSDIEEVFEKFKAWAELQCNEKIKHLQSDNALEFKKLSKTLDKYGINHRLSCPYSHQQMGTVERRHRHIVDTAIALLKKAQLPSKFWDFAVLTVVYLYNRNPSDKLSSKSPME